MTIHTLAVVVFGPGCAFIAAWITLGLRTHPSQHAPAEGGEGDRGGVRGLHLGEGQ